MKQIFISLLISILLFVCLTTKTHSAEPSLSAQSAILIEVSTGEVIYEKNPEEVLPPASITKIMTLILIFDELSEGKIHLNDEVTVSAHAASMGGSQVFLEEGEKQTVETMIKCISISSANDACVAMAEYICGDEATFVNRMNMRAKELGMNKTTFKNSCGLDEDGHLTTAKDISIMSRELLTKYPEIQKYCTIWMENIIHRTRNGDKEFTLTNTNKLIRQYEWATGLKTGSTDLAKFCLSASAKKNDVELIGVVMACDSGKTRISDSIALLNHGFANCEIYRDTTSPTFHAPVLRGRNDEVECRPVSPFSHLFKEVFDEKKITTSVEFNDSLEAPVYVGEIIGQISYFYDNKLIGTVDLEAIEDVERTSFSHCLNILLHSLT